MFLLCLPGSLILLVHQVRDAKLKVLASLKQETDEERLEWKELSALLKGIGCLILIKLFF